jgi:large subunit ribosomal protein L5
MTATAPTAPTARLKTRYLEEIRPALVGRFGYTSVMQAPRLEKVTVNMGIGLAKQDSKMLKAARDQLATIAGQQPSVRRARKSIAAFKLREGMPVGVAVTLRSDRGYEFLDRLVSIAIPRIRDFRGLSPRSFDGRGNYSLGVREQIIFPEIDYDAIDEVRGLDITITTSAATDVEAFALLLALGMPFATQGRPAGFDDAEPEAAQDSAEKPDTAASAEKADAAKKPDTAKRAAKKADTASADGNDSARQIDATAASAERGETAAASAEPGDAAASAQQGDTAATSAEQSASPEPSDTTAQGAADVPAAEQNDVPGDGDTDTAEKESTD